jgi:hypothetical protein
MKEILHLNTQVDTTPVKATVDVDPVLAIIMRSDMAKAFPEIAAAMVRSYNENESNSSSPS